jgi:hypothetical protein
MILAKFTDGVREINLTTYSSADDIARFKMLPANLVKINPLLHAYHVTQFTVNTQMNEAYNGTRFSISEKKDDGVYVDSFRYCNVLSKEEHNIPIYESDDDVTKTFKHQVINRVRAEKRRIENE